MKNHSNTPRAFPWIGWIILISGGGCQAHPLADGLPESMNCSSCHGSDDNPAPPQGLYGAIATTTIGVGAHLSHLGAERVSRPVACTECHIVPDRVDGDSHPDPLAGPAVVTFGPLARTTDIQPSWNRAQATCTNVYCHGATLRHGSTRAPPVWTLVDGSQKTCTSCHGNPPGDTHPRNTKCDVCHGEVVDADGVIIKNKLHINGMVEVRGHSLTPGTIPACSHCHSQTDLGRSHTNHSAYLCSACHGEVVNFDALILIPERHGDGKVDVRLTVGSWDPVVRTCTGTGSGCHGKRSLTW